MVLVGDNLEDLAAKGERVLFAPDFTSEGGVVSVDNQGDLADIGRITQFGLDGDTVYRSFSCQ